VNSLIGYERLKKQIKNVLNADEQLSLKLFELNNQKEKIVSIKCGVQQKVTFDVIMKANGFN